LKCRGARAFPYISFTLVPYSFFLMNIWLPPSLLPCELHNTSPWILINKKAEYTRVKNIFDHNRLFTIHVVATGFCRYTYYIMNQSFNIHYIIIHKIHNISLHVVTIKLCARVVYLWYQQCVSDRLITDGGIRDDFDIYNIIRKYIVGYNQYNLKPLKKNVSIRYFTIPMTW